MTGIRAIADALLSVVIAPGCASCGRLLDEPTRGAVCDGCWTSIPRTTDPVCELCGDALTTWRQPGAREGRQDGTPDGHSARCQRCRRSARVITIGRSIAPYEGTLREILHALKYERRRSLAAPLASLMAARGAQVLDGADAVVPVPLHFLRQYHRGFNQASELARHLDVPVLECLRRTRATITQTDLPEARRHENVRGAFRLRRRVPSGAVLVVVDDVSTTGATVDACARVLLEGGAKEVRALTAARAAARLP
jgi:ComF family protein